MSEAAHLETSLVQANRNAARALAVSLVAGLAIAAGAGEANSETTSARTAGASDCAPYFDLSRFRNHQYEVCSAYVGNSAEVALQGFYKFGNNRAGYLAAPSRHHFETRYWAGPRQAIEREVDSWPKTSAFTGNSVEENINVVSVSSNLRANRGLVKTRESWRVSSGGSVLHDEPEHTRNVTMCRGKLPGHFLHEWVVAKLVSDPNYNCIAFDKRHGLKP